MRVAAAAATVSVAAAAGMAGRVVVWALVAPATAAAAGVVGEVEGVDWASPAGGVD